MIPVDQMPPRIRRLPRDKRGFPIPKFVAWVDDKPVFPVAVEKWLVEAHTQDRCYICGDKLGRFRASTIGPMCAVNRTISEPPSHTDCARFAAMHCPFLNNPDARRVPTEKLQQKCPAGGHSPEAILRNPKAVCVWVAEERSRPVRTATGGFVFRLPEPAMVEWYARGRPATRAEIVESIESGLPLLEALCDTERTDKRRAEARAHLADLTAQAMKLLPAE